MKLSRLARARRPDAQIKPRTRHRPREVGSWKESSSTARFISSPFFATLSFSAHPEASLAWNFTNDAEPSAARYKSSIGFPASPAWPRGVLETQLHSYLATINFLNIDATDTRYDSASIERYNEMNPPDSNRCPRATAARVRTATTTPPPPARPFLANRTERCARLFAGKLFNSGLARSAVHLLIRTLRTFVRTYVHSLARSSVTDTSPSSAESRLGRNQLSATEAACRSSRTLEGICQTLHASVSAIRVSVSAIQFARFTIRMYVSGLRERRCNRPDGRTEEGRTCRRRSSRARSRGN